MHYSLTQNQAKDSRLCEVHHCMGFTYKLDELYGRDSYVPDRSIPSTNLPQSAIRVTLIVCAVVPVHLTSKFVGQDRTFSDRTKYSTSKYFGQRYTLYDNKPAVPTPKRTGFSYFEHQQQPKQTILNRDEDRLHFEFILNVLHER
jgi:hypothetical protein